MNRAPGPADIWWNEHDINCGGSFSKIAEPEGYKSQLKKPIGKKKGQYIIVCNYEWLLFY